MQTATTYRRFTKKEYFDLLERSRHRFEYFGGLVYSMYHEEPLEDLSEGYVEELMKKIYHSYNHSRVIQNIVGRLFKTLEEDKYLIYSEGRSVLLAGQEEDDSYVFPDIVIAEEGNERRDPETNLLLNPVVVMEVLSKSTQKRDRKHKREGYERIAELSEYLVFEQTHVEAHHFVKQGEAWGTGSIFNRLEETLRLKALACELPLAQAYKGCEFD